MTAFSDATVGALIGAVAAVVVSGFGALFVRRKTKAETTDIFMQAAERLVASYVAQVEHLERRVEHAEKCFLRCEQSRHEDRLLMEQMQAQIVELQGRLDRKG